MCSARMFMSLLESVGTSLSESRPAGLLNDHRYCHSARVPGGKNRIRNQATGVHDRHFCMLMTLVYTLSLFCNRQLEELCLQSPQVWKVLVLFLVSAAFPVPNEMRISLASVFIRSEHQSRYGASFVSGPWKNNGPRVTNRRNLSDQR